MRFKVVWLGLFCLLGVAIMPVTAALTITSRTGSVYADGSGGWNGDWFTGYDENGYPIIVPAGDGESVSYSETGVPVSRSSGNYILDSHSAVTKNSVMALSAGNLFPPGDIINPQGGFYLVTQSILTINFTTGTHDKQLDLEVQGSIHGCGGYWEARLANENDIIWFHRYEWGENAIEIGQFDCLPNQDYSLILTAYAYAQGGLGSSSYQQSDVGVRSLVSTPEPMTLSLLALGGLALGRKRR